VEREGLYQGIAPMFAARPNAKAMPHRYTPRRNCSTGMWLKASPVRRKPEHDSFTGSPRTPPTSRRSSSTPNVEISRRTPSSRVRGNPSTTRRCVPELPSLHPQLADAAGPVHVSGHRPREKIDFSAVVAMNGKKQVTEIQRFQEDWPDRSDESWPPRSASIPLAWWWTPPVKATCSSAS